MMALLGVASIHAHPGPGKGPRNPEKAAQKATEKMKAALALSEDQSKKVYDINLQSIRNIEIVKKDTLLAPKDRKARHKAIQEQRKSELRKVLTPEQFAQMEKLEEERKEHRKEKKR